MKPLEVQYHTIRVYHSDGRMEVYEHWPGGSKVLVLPSDVPEEFKNIGLVALVLGLENLNRIDKKLKAILEATPYYLNSTYNAYTIPPAAKNRYLTLHITQSKT